MLLNVAIIPEYGVGFFLSYTMAMLPADKAMERVGSFGNRFTSAFL